MQCHLDLRDNSNYSKRKNDMKLYRQLLILGFLSLSLASCALNKDILKRAANNGWDNSIIKTETMFDLVSFETKSFKDSNIIIIYIEGDGFAWRNRKTPSKNPTPRHPVALKLALNHTSDDENVVYLARPCQYIDLKTQPACASKYWTSHRFAPEIIISTNVAIDQLKSKYGADNIKLVGYSGGGAVAALVAAQRDDVIKLVTFAGNLDTATWTKHHNISPLHGSLNPADYWQDLVSIPQVHYVGEYDQIVPLKVTLSYVQNFPDNQKPLSLILENYTHYSY